MTGVHHHEHHEDALVETTGVHNPKRYEDAPVETTGVPSTSSRRERPLTYTLKRSLAKGSMFLIGSIMTDAAALTTAIGANADVIQFGGPPSLSEPLVQRGYEAMFYKPEEFQKCEKDTTYLDAKVIWASPPMRAHMQRTFTREMASPSQARNHERALRRERSGHLKLCGCLARGLQRGRDFVVEMPAKLRDCWQEVSYLKDAASEHGMTVYDFKVHGCAFGMKCNGVPVLKEWRIMTTSEPVKIGMERRCPGHQEHVDDHGGCFRCSDPRWFPKALEKCIVDSLSWTLQSRHRIRTLAAAVETELLQQLWFDRKYEAEMPEGAYALTRQKIPTEPPTGRSSRRSSKWCYAYTVPLDIPPLSALQSYWNGAGRRAGRLSWQNQWNVLRALRLNDLCHIPLPRLKDLPRYGKSVALMSLSMPSRRKLDRSRN